MPVGAPSILIWMMAALLGAVYWARSMSKLLQAPKVGVRVTAFSWPAEMIDTLTLVTSAVHRSRCSLLIAETLIGVAAQSMPS